jgi:hypothetical protein
MNPRGFFQLLRLRSLLSYLFVWAVFLIISAIGLGSRTADAVTFALMILMVPFLVYGSLLAATAQEAFHTTFGGVLPGLRRTIRRWFTISSIATSLGWAAVVHALRPDIPMFPAWMLSWLMACLLLPSESGHTGRSLAIKLGSVIVVGAVFFQARLLLECTIAHPWLIGAAAGCGAPFCVLLGFDRERLRRQALTPRISPFGDWDERSLERRIQSLKHPFQGRTATRRWRETWLGNDLWAWARAASYENSGRKLLSLVAVFPLLNLALDLFAAYPKPGQRADFIYYMLADPAAYHGGFSPTYNLLTIIFAMILGVLATAGLQNDRVYPLSRRDRAGVCFRSVLSFELGLVLSWGLIQLVIALVARMQATAPRPIPIIPWFVFELGLVLSILPLLQWARFIPKRLGCVGTLLTAFVLMPALIGWIVMYFAASVLRLPSLTTCLVTCAILPVATHMLAWYLLRRDYARRDLITVPS